MHVCLDGPKFLSKEQLEKIVEYTKTMLLAEFLCDVFCFDFLLVCLSEPCSLTYLEVFIDVLMIYIILD